MKNFNDLPHRSKKLSYIDFVQELKEHKNINNLIEDIPAVKKYTSLKVYSKSFLLHIEL